MSRPPLVVFLAFIAALCLSLLSLAYFIDGHDLTDAEATHSWYQMINKLPAITFCLHNSTPSLNSTQLNEAANNVDANNVDANVDNLVNVSISLPVSITSHGNVSQLVHHLSVIHGMSSLVPAYYLVSTETHFVHNVAIYANFHPAYNVPVIGGSQQQQQQQQVSSASRQFSTTDHLRACVTFQLPRGSLPSDAPSLTCNGTEFDTLPHTVHADASKLNSKARAVQTYSHQLSSACSLSSSGVSVRFASDGPLDGEDNPVLLDMLEKSKVRFRLHVASYFLFVAMLSAVLYVVLRKRVVNLGGGGGQMMHSPAKR